MPIRLLGLGLAIVVLGFVAWRVLSLGAADFLAAADPQAALGWRPDHAEATFSHFELRSKPGTFRPMSDEQARAAIRSAPLDGRGYARLARNAEAAGRMEEAEKLNLISARRGPRNLRVLAWLVERELQRRNYPQAFAHIDQILRVQPELSIRLTPELSRLAADPAAQSAFAEVLRRNPPWRTDFLGRLVSSIPNPIAVLPLMEALRQGPGGLSEAELGAWIDRLGQAREWGSAYLIWTQSLSPEQSARIGNVFNGGFETEPSGFGFDWRLTRIPGARVSRGPEAGAEGQAALRVEFEGRRVPFEHVRQMLALAPGRYRLSGKVKLEGLRSSRGLVWALSCSEDGRPLGATEPMTGQSPWRSFQLEFEVPAEGCGGQWLTLKIPARIAAEQLIVGAAAFDDLRIKLVSN